MDSKEIETLAELISIKTSEKYMAITKEHITTQIELHESQCMVKKTARSRNFFSGIVGGSVVGGVIVFLRWVFK